MYANAVHEDGASGSKFSKNKLNPICSPISKYIDNLMILVSNSNKMW